MALDPYSPCPAGTGKKLKFCCPDLATELEKLNRMLEGEQRSAALEWVEQLEAKYPDRACLLSAKAMLATELGQMEKAEATVAHFQEKHPDNPVAMAEAATLSAMNDPRRAVGLLQGALERVQEQLPMPVYEALSVVALALYSQGEVMAARAHWMFQVGLSGGKDEQALRLLLQLQGSPDVPLLLKEELEFSEAPADALWKKTFDEILQIARHGRWQQAANQFEALSAKVGAWPPIRKNLAILRSWLADEERATSQWHSLAAESIPLDDAVEAEATAQLLERDGDDAVDLVKVTYGITDIEALTAQLLANKQALRLPADLQALATEDQPPPKGLYSLLDRPRTESAANLQVADVPLVVGQVLIYGKQTDREARAELIASRQELAKAQGALVAVGDSSLGSVLSEEVVGQISAAEEVLSLKWHLPSELPFAERQRLLEQGQRERILKVWPELKPKRLAGLTIRTAAAEPKHRITVLAMILILDLGTPIGDFDFNELRSELGLPPQEPVDPREHSPLRLPLARLARLELGKLTDDDLLLAFERAQQARFLRAVKRLAREIASRPSLDKELDKSAIFSLLAQLEPNSEQATKDLDEARRIATAAGKSTARIDLVELTLRMGQGDVATADRLLAHIRDEHLREPGIAQALYSLLAQWGVVRPDGSMPAEAGGAPMQGIMAPGSASSEPTGGGKIWTPGAEPAPGGKKSAIWTPGME